MPVYQVELFLKSDPMIPLLTFYLSSQRLPSPSFLKPLVYPVRFPKCNLLHTHPPLLQRYPIDQNLRYHSLTILRLKSDLPQNDHAPAPLHRDFY